MLNSFDKAPILFTNMDRMDAPISLANSLQGLVPLDKRNRRLIWELKSLR